MPITDQELFAYLDRLDIGRPPAKAFTLSRLLAAARVRPENATSTDAALRQRIQRRLDEQIKAGAMERDKFYDPDSQRESMFYWWVEQPPADPEAEP